MAFRSLSYVLRWSPQGGRNFYSTGLKSSLPTPHNGHTQSAGRSSNAVPGAIPLSSSPTAGSYTYPQITHTYFFIFDRILIVSGFLSHFQKRGIKNMQKYPVFQDFLFPWGQMPADGILTVPVAVFCLNFISIIAFWFNQITEKHRISKKFIQKIWNVVLFVYLCIGHKKIFFVSIC